MRGLEADETGESRKTGLLFRMADDERRVFLMQSLYSVATTCLCVATTQLPFQLTLAASPQTSRKSRRTLVDPIFALNERGKRFGVFGRLRSYGKSAKSS
jgi:hypothetical protein